MESLSHVLVKIVNKKHYSSFEFFFFLTTFFFFFVPPALALASACFASSLSRLTSASASACNCLDRNCASLRISSSSSDASDESTRRYSSS